MASSQETSQAVHDCFLVIPCYRESERLPAFLLDLLEAIEESRLSVAVQVIDDGSPRKDGERLRGQIDYQRRRFRFLCPIVRHRVNRGKGRAIRTGWALPEARSAPWLAFIDGDGAVSASEFLRLLRIASHTQPQSMVIASRRHPDSQARRLRRREILSAVFAAAVRWRYALDVSDTQCGCKILPADFVSMRLDQLRQDAYGLDLELLRHAKQDGLPIVEVGVKWHEIAGSKLRLASSFGLLLKVLMRKI